MLLRRILRPLITIIFALSFLLTGLWLFQPSINYAIFSLVGVIGAIFANATGAGGGAVFVPIFKVFQLSNQQIIATSFTIQCFGMVAGSVSWLIHYRSVMHLSQAWKPFKAIIPYCALPSIMTLVGVYMGALFKGIDTELYFSLFSIVMGLIIVYSQLINREEASSYRTSLDLLDRIMLIAIGIIGGVITSIISVGVGEILAVYLILRGFSVSLSIASAVVVTALTVWAGTYHHWIANANVVMDVVVFAVPGAILGGYVASYIVSKISASVVKFIFAAWIIFSGALMLLIG